MAASCANLANCGDPLACHRGYVGRLKSEQTGNAPRSRCHAVEDLTREKQYTLGAILQPDQCTHLAATGRGWNRSIVDERRGWNRSIVDESGCSWCQRDAFRRHHRIACSVQNGQLGLTGIGLVDVDRIPAKRLPWRHTQLWRALDIGRTKWEVRVESRNVLGMAMVRRSQRDDEREHTARKKDENESRREFLSHVFPL